MSIICNEGFEGRLADLVKEYYPPSIAGRIVDGMMKHLERDLKRRKSRPRNKDEPRHKLSNEIIEVVRRKVGNVYERLMESKLFSKRRAKTLAVVLVSFPLVDRDFKEDFGIPRIPFYIFVDTFKNMLYQGSDGILIKINVCRNTFSKYYEKVWLDKEKRDNEQKRIIEEFKEEIRTKASSWF